MNEKFIFWLLFDSSLVSLNLIKGGIKNYVLLVDSTSQIVLGLGSMAFGVAMVSAIALLNSSSRGRDDVHA